MKYVTQNLHCGDVLLTSVADELQDLSNVLSAHRWAPDYSFNTSTATLQHQAAYNKSLSIAFAERGWNFQPRLSDSPRLIGDFAKGLVFGEVQFGNRQLRIPLNLDIHSNRNRTVIPRESGHPFH